MLNKDEKVETMITKLLEVRGKKPGKAVSLHEDDLKHLCTKSREIFISQPNLLELEAPIKICGKFKSRWPTCRPHVSQSLTCLFR
jgi:serine/threonine-protein phosphatase PP1 catalytic subunit